VATTEELTAPRQARPPDLESLRCFLAGAKHATFRRAAKAVALSPAAFSDRIARLEEQLERSLFQRSTRSVRLTTSGERLVPQAERALAEARRCVDVVSTEDTTPPFDLVVGTRFELGLSWLVPMLDALETAEPARRLHLHFGQSDDLLDQLDRDHIDAFISSARLTRSGLAYARLHEEQYAFVASGALLEERPLRKARDARHHRLLELHPDLPLFRYLLDARPGDEVWAFDRMQFLGTIGAVRACVIDGSGVAVLPAYFVAEDLKAGRLVSLLPRTKLHVDWFRLVWKEGHPRSEALRRLGTALAAVPLR